MQSRPTPEVRLPNKSQIKLALMDVLKLPALTVDPAVNTPQAGKVGVSFVRKKLALAF